jgi:hypothetical protein
MVHELKCNVLACSKTLEENTYLLSCGHALCEPHGKTVGTTCIICTYPVSTLIKNFSQKHISQKKKLRLVGYAPKDILDSLKVGMEFWDFQTSLFMQESRNSINKPTAYFDKCIKLESEKNEIQANYNILKEKYMSLNHSYQRLQKQKDVPRPKETPLIFCPPSNQRIRNSENAFPKKLSIFTPRN